MSDLIAPLERLGAEVERMAYAAERRPARRDRRRSRRLGGVRRPSLAIALLLLALLAAATALAATSGWLTGDPVKERPGYSFKPDVGLGRVVPGTAHLTTLRVADPAGGPPWGIRTLHTTRALGCVQIGRVVDGKLGVLGRDGAFNNDNKFHELPASVLSQSQCAPLDGADHSFVAISYSGLPASALSTACLARPIPTRPGAKSPTPADLPDLCPRADLRNVLYGTLGPQGKAITYAAGTQQAAGPDGAYLVVQRPTAQHPASGSWYTLQTPGSGLKAVHYRDGSTCRVVSARRAGGAKPCPAKGQVVAPLKPGQVRAPITATVAPKLVHPLTGPPGHQERGPASRLVTIRFRAPIATPDARSYYTVSLALDPHAAHRCGFAGLSGPVARSVAAGEDVHDEFWLQPTCHERVTATVRLHRLGKTPDVDVYGGGRNPKDDALVGTTTFQLP